MSTITALQILIFAAYVGYIWRRFGVLSSISASSYELRGNERYLFFFWLFSLALLNWFQDMGFWGFLMSISFVIAGLTLDHRKGKTLEDEIHTIFSIVAIGSGFVGLYLLHSIWIPMLAFIGGAMILFVWARNRIWWIEILAMALIATGYVMR